METNKRYSLLTAIAMVVGIVIGSGVFFKAGNVLSATNGNLVLSILAWVIGGLVMIISAYTFSIIALNTKKSGDLVDMAEESTGRRHGYVLSWYFAVIYYPVLVGVLAWVCANYTCILFGIEGTSPIVILAFIYLTLVALMNIIAPKIAGYFQISTTAIKLIPLAFMAIAGVIYGLASNDGTLVENFTSGAVVTGGNGFMAALCATCFAYEGWIVATTISKELKDPAKNLSKALVIGTIIVLSTYILYYIGLSGTFLNSEFITGGEAQVKSAFSQILGNVGGTLLYVFVIISCIGTLNGLTMGCVRSFKSTADSKNGPCIEKFTSLNRFEMNTYSSLIGFGLSIIWLSIWLISLYKGLMTGAWWGIDLSELVIIFVYGAYIPMYISMIKKREDLGTIKRFVVPSLAICASSLMLVAAVIGHGVVACALFLAITSIIITIGLKFYKKEKNI